MPMEKVNKVFGFGGDRFVVGPQNEIGYIAKKPGHGAAIELILLKREQNREKERKRALMKADSRRTLQKNDAEEKWALMDMRTAMDRIVNLGLQKAEEELSEKRNRLKINLLEEEAALMFEYTDEAQKANDKILTRNKEKVEGILSRKILSDKAFNEAIKEKIALNKSETYAERIRVQNLKNAVEANLAQIRANEYIKTIDKEEEQLWEKLDRDRVETIANEMRAVTELQRERQKMYKESLDKQVESNGIFRANKNLTDEFENEILEKWQDEKAKTLKEQSEQMEQRRRHHFEDCKKQKDNIQSLRLKNVTGDLEFEEILVKDVHQKFLNDSAKQVSQKQQLKQELMSFQSSVQKYKQTDKKADDDFSKFVAEEANRLRAEENLSFRSGKNARKTRLAEMITENKRLAAEKLERESVTKEMDKVYHEFRIRETEILNKVDEMLQFEYRKNYETAPTNLANSEYSNSLKLRRRLDENEYDRKIASETAEMEATVRDKLAKRIDDFSAKHPFYEKLRKCEI
ncbi:Hypothetical protein NTJ_11259 [Nesidiocoris tenuis]|uniref:Trichohyalin-plectin-homology domain-containing protein n=1 Tax=Nesidiocoris tenuis TaxID=355587 RepID=A0ABN7B5J2_9HEMI|nr:Hypothetical protein NTJ_11259 [Nesidiocoris tenuis]